MRHTVPRGTSTEFETGIDYFHDCDVDKIRRLQTLKEVSEESKLIESAKNRVGFDTVLSVGHDGSDINLSSSDRPRPLTRKTYVVVNLTQVTSPLACLLYFWDAFDYMIDNIEQVEKWCICFRENGGRQYVDFINETVDRLFCQRWDNLPDILSKIPYYTSGILTDEPSDVPIQRWIDLEYVAPTSKIEAFKACISHNLKHLGGGIYFLK
ncbi:alpha-n-acetylgalactosaminidase precursor [Lasius niger]|uniref:Alpha-n-acetylgalactosaminidase n=1 Tax=Lasius niger TaxID=67767 RepID=A0A0J7MPB6_LASNI|nr:alpha-n-acetylgalactosaminidase precursor [Lasius niger]